MNDNFVALKDYKLWGTLSSNQQDAIISSVEKYLEKEFFFKFTDSYLTESNLRIPTFEHVSSKIEFNLIIGGEFSMGLSQEEELYAKSIDPEINLGVETMRPLQKVTIEPFLISRAPISEPLVEKYVDLDPNLFRPEFDLDDESMPIYLTRDEASEFLKVFNFQFTSEAQWEYACRGGTESLFYFGNILPESDILESTIFCNNFSDKSQLKKYANPFGLVGLFIGEWCKDLYRENYNNLTEPVDESYVVRGGGSIWWPWQDCNEWVLCMSASRRSSSLLEDGTCGLRVVRELDL